MRPKFNYLVVILILFIPFYSLAEPLNDPFVGDYEGLAMYSQLQRQTPLVAEVYPIGNDVYAIKFMNAFSMRAEVFALVYGTSDGEKLIFNSGVARGIISNDSLRGDIIRGMNLMSFEMKKVERSSPTEGARPTKEAIVLFDGSDFDEWNPASDIPVKWKIVNGNELEVVPRMSVRDPKTDIVTRREFTDIFIHLEFKLSLMPEMTGQQRCNSGLIFNEIAEVQILDSYGLEGLWNECGALYHISPPKVNMCFPPLRWQTYDVILHGPRFDKNGKRTKDAVMTVFHNGKRIHYQYPIKKGPDQLEDGQTEFTFKIQLQDHRNILWFRNIWAIDLAKNSELPEFMDNLGE